MENRLRNLMLHLFWFTYKYMYQRSINNWYGFGLLMWYVYVQWIWCHIDKLFQFHGWKSIFYFWEWRHFHHLNNYTVSRLILSFNADFLKRISSINDSLIFCLNMKSIFSLLEAWVISFCHFRLIKDFMSQSQQKYFSLGK